MSNTVTYLYRCHTPKCYLVILLLLSKPLNLEKQMLYLEK